MDSEWVHFGSAQVGSPVAICYDHRLGAVGSRVVLGEGMSNVRGGLLFDGQDPHETGPFPGERSAHVD